MKESITILFVDDSSNDRVLFRHMLHEIDPAIDYQTATSGEDAISFLNTVDALPDYIFLDLKMQGMNGIECLELIKNHPKTAGIPVIIYSADESKSFETMARQLGALQYLAKSVEYEQSVRDIKSILLADSKENEPSE
jgi:CheY-like chemotaxis protein